MPGEIGGMQNAGKVFNPIAEIDIATFSFVPDATALKQQTKSALNQHKQTAVAAIERGAQELKTGLADVKEVIASKYHHVQHDIMT